MDDEKKEPTIREYLNKPMHLATLGDHLALQVSAIVFSMSLSLAVSGWMGFVQRRLSDGK